MTNTNVKWNSACWERKEKREKLSPAVAGFSLFSFLSQQAKFHLTFTISMLMVKWKPIRIIWYTTRWLNAVKLAEAAQDYPIEIANLYAKSLSPCVCVFQCVCVCVRACVRVCVPVIILVVI